MSNKVRVKSEYTMTGTAVPAASPSASRSAVVVKREPMEDDEFYMSESSESEGTPVEPLEISSDDGDDEFRDLDDPEPKWPGDYYAADIVPCLIALHKASKEGRRKDLPKIFHSFFPNCRYVRQTCWDNCKRFKGLPHHLKKAATSAGHLPAGLWSNVMKNAPSLKSGQTGATIRATATVTASKPKKVKKERPAASASAHAMREVIEISD
jgi:hypothetical protein